MPTKLSGPERHLRARIATKTRHGQDTEPDRRAFVAIQAEREFREAAERLVAARVDQGLAGKVDDPGTLARIASLLVGSAPENKTAEATHSPAVIGGHASGHPTER